MKVHVLFVIRTLKDYLPFSSLRILTTRLAHNLISSVLIDGAIAGDVNKRGATANESNRGKSA